MDEFFEGTGIITSSTGCCTAPEEVKIPTKLSELENDSNFIRDPNYQHTDNNFTNEHKEIVESIDNLPKVVEEAIQATDRANNSAYKAELISNNPPKIVNNYWWIFSIVDNKYINSEIRANGKDFVIRKTYSSISEMNDDFSNPAVEVGEFVMVNTADVSKLFLKSDTEWVFISDLKGATGLSAYEIAKKYGFSGTESEWILSLKQPALDAATEANKATSEVKALSKEVSEAESSRVENENYRQSAESGRIKSETIRKTNESTRISNESTRQSNETIRKENETVRETAESNRTTTFTNTINEVNTAKAKTEAAITGANNAANSATTAASNANTATSDLRKLEQTVTQAENTRKTQEATRVQQEKSREDRTNKAISDTNSAKEATITAKDDAIAATTAATEATNKANTATSNANTATTKANAATSSANTAASNANTQANRAKKHADNPPSITEDGYWQTFNEASDEYVKTTTLAKGVSGVYVGSGDMPDGYNVQIDPTGDTIDYAQDIHQLEESMLAINVDRCGNLTAESIDVINIPKICGCPFVKIESSAPTTSPDFVGQMYIDTKSGKVYMATDVANVSSYKVLN